MLEQLKNYYTKFLETNSPMHNQETVQSYLLLLENFTHYFSRKTFNINIDQWFNTENQEEQKIWQERRDIMLNTFLNFLLILKSEYIHMLQFRAYIKLIQPFIENVPHEIKQDLLLAI